LRRPSVKYVTLPDDDGEVSHIYQTEVGLMRRIVAAP